MSSGSAAPSAASAHTQTLLRQLEQAYFQEPGTALTLIEAVQAQAQGAGDGALLAGALLWRGIVELWLGEHRAARASLEAARDLAHAGGDAVTEARCVNNLAILAFRQGDYAGAMQLQLTNLTLTQQAGDLAGQLRARLNISMLHVELEEHQQALAAQQEVLREARRQKLVHVACAAGESVAASLLALGRCEAALRAGRRALPDIRRARASQSAANLHRTLAAALTSLGRPGEALAECTAGAPAALLTQDPVARCGLLIEEGRARALMGQPEAALSALNEAVALSTGGERRREQSEALFQRAALHEQLGDWQRALADFRAHTELERVLRAERIEIRTRTLAAQAEAERFRHQAERERERGEALARANRELRLAQTRLAHLAEHDALTGLPGRTLLERRLGAALAGGRPLAVLFVDLDRFKSINDTLGHQQGDALLCETARRLSEALAPGQLLARLGGDEFIVLAEGLDEEAAEALAGRVHTALVAPFVSGRRRLHVTASVGLALAPRDGQEVAELLRRADTAMYRVKQSGRNGVLSFSPAMAAELESRVQLEQDLHGALARGELHLHYQPQWQLGQGQPGLRGVEALLRWQHPRLGRISPSRFIPLAEESGLIVGIGNWVLRQATGQAAQWHRAGLDSLNVAVNVSPIQFARPDFVAEVEAALQESGLPPQALELEVTESAVMRDTAETTRHLERLHQLGVRVAIDDFGTGHASLGLLRRLKVNTLKVDRSFVQDLTNRQDARPLIEAILALARGLGLSVVAEGAETEAQLAALRELGCAEVQGYLLAHPLSAEDLTPLLRAHLGAQVLGEREAKVAPALLFTPPTL